MPLTTETVNRVLRGRQLVDAHRQRAWSATRLEREVFDEELRRALASEGFPTIDAFFEFNQQTVVALSGEALEIVDHVNCPVCGQVWLDALASAPQDAFVLWRSAQHLAESPACTLRLKVKAPLLVALEWR